MAFIRVRQAKGPSHEFDISVAAYERKKASYKVIDKTPVRKPRPAKYVQVKQSAAPAKTAGKPAKSAGKPAGKES